MSLSLLQNFIMFVVCSSISAWAQDLTRVQVEAGIVDRCGDYLNTTYTSKQEAEYPTILHYFNAKPFKLLIQVQDEQTSIKGIQSKLLAAFENKAKVYDIFALKTEMKEDLFEPCTFVEYKSVRYLVFPYEKLPRLDNLVISADEVTARMNNLLINPKNFKVAVKILFILDNSGSAYENCEKCGQIMTYAEYELRSIDILMDYLPKGSTINIVFTDDRVDDYAMFPQYIDVLEARKKIPTWEAAPKLLDDYSKKTKINVKSFCPISIPSVKDEGMRSILENIASFGGNPTIAVFFTDGVIGNADINSALANIPEEAEAVRKVSFPVYFKIMQPNDTDMLKSIDYFKKSVAEYPETQRRNREALKRHQKSWREATTQEDKAFYADLIRSDKEFIARDAKYLQESRTLLENAKLDSEISKVYFERVPRNPVFVLPAKYDLSSF